MTLSDWACSSPEGHAWLPVGDGYYGWISTGAGDERPSDAPYFRRYICCNCAANCYIEEVSTQGASR